MRKYSAEEILEALTYYYDESIFVTGSEGEVIFVNELGAQRLGCTREEILHKNVRDLLKDGKYDNSTVLVAMDTKKPYTGQISEGKMGRTSTVSHSVPVLDDDGNVSMVVTNNMSKERSEEWESIMRREHEATERLKRELDYLRDNSNNEIYANSPSMKTLLKSVDVIAPADSNVIILGESGTGKDVFANYIHSHSNRSGNPFISVNCAAIPENLLESELFGYEKGAFTGANSKGKIGLFEAAEGGTIFLDEIGDMPLALQSKLLRTLESRYIRRVGGVEAIPINVRIICATNADLAKMVEEKKFREDLYYRLSVFVIKLPPLRERKEDILALADHFLYVLNEKYGQNKRFSEVTRQTMLDHNWPGNIRELRNVIERIFVISNGDELVFTPTPTAQYMPGLIKEENGDVAIRPLREYTEEMENRYIEIALKQCDGSVAKAAEMLGLHRSVLYRRLQKSSNCTKEDMNN